MKSNSLIVVICFSKESVLGFLGKEEELIKLNNM